LPPLRLRPGVRGEDEGARAVVDAGRVAGRVRAVPSGQARQRGEALERGVAPGRLVDLDDRLALAALDRDGRDLLGQAPVVRGGDRALVRAEGPAVHVGAR